MKRIILHWTGGKYTPSSTDFSHYHFLVDKKGDILKGNYAPEDNLNCNDGHYAAHTGGYKSPKCIGDYPFLRVQGEAALSYCATLLKKYVLKPSIDTVLTHYEAGKMLPKSSSAGKIDITFIPYEPKITAQEAGDYIRNKGRGYYER